ncbi:Strigolactone esterase D14 [Linum perenne]
MNARTFGSTSRWSETIVLAHGFGGDQSAWDDIIPVLTQHYQVVSFDWCFSGAIKDPNFYDHDKYSSYDSFADDLICLIEEMGLHSVVFLGHSMSGMIGCIASIKRYMNAEDYEGGFEGSHIEDLINNIQTNFSKWAPSFAAMVIGRGGDNVPSAVEKFGNSLLNMEPKVALSVAKTVFYCDYRGVLGKVTTPTTIVQTTNDAAVPTSVAYYMHERIKGKSTVEIIDTDGHFPHLTASDDLLDLLGGVLGFAA